MLALSDTFVLSLALDRALDGGHLADALPRALDLGHRLAFSRSLALSLALPLALFLALARGCGMEMLQRHRLLALQTP